MRQPAVVVGEQPRGRGEAVGGPFEVGGRGIASNPRDDEREEIEVQRVAVVVRRALAVTAVRGDLAIDLGHEDATADRGAAFGRRELRQRASRDIQGQRFAGEMRVGAEVVRQVVLDVPELTIEPEQQIDNPRRVRIGPAAGFSWTLGAGEKLQRPDPRQRA